jgi:hypothetical protein
VGDQETLVQEPRRLATERIAALKRAGFGPTAVVLVIVGAIAALAMSAFVQTGTPAQRSVPAWALPWPDQRDRGILRPALDALIWNWKQEDTSTYGPVDPSRPPQQYDEYWYLAKRIPECACVLAMAEASGLNRRSLIVGDIGLDDDMRSASDGSDWRWLDGPAPNPRSHRFVGGYLYGTHGDQDRVVWLLTSPTYDRVQVEGGKTYRLHQGFVAFDAGVLRDRVRVRFEDHGATKASGFVGVPGIPFTFEANPKNVVILR